MILVDGAGAFLANSADLSLSGSSVNGNWVSGAWGPSCSGCQDLLEFGVSSCGFCG